MSLIETAIEDLQAVSSHFRRQIPSTPGTIQISKLNSQLDEKTLQIDQSKEAIERLIKNRKQTDQQIKDIDAKLRDTAAAKVLQQNRDRLNTQLNHAKRRQKQFEGEVYKWLGENGRFIVSKTDY